MRVLPFLVSLLDVEFFVYGASAGALRANPL